MPRFPSQRSSQERRWRSLRVATLLREFIGQSSSLPISYNHRQNQVPYNKVEDIDGMLLSILICTCTHAITLANPYRIITSGSQPPQSSSSTEGPQTSDLPIAKPRKLNNVRLQQLLNWESEQYAAIQV